MSKKKILEKVPLKKEAKAQIFSHIPRELKDRVDLLLEKLKKTDPERDWSFNKIYAASIELFVESMEEK